MIKIGKEYASGSVAKGDLYKRRNELMLTTSSSSSSQAQRKRPAARSEQKTEPVEEMHEAEVEVQTQNEAPVTPPT